MESFNCLNVYIATGLDRSSDTGHEQDRRTGRNMVLRGVIIRRFRRGDEMRRYAVGAFPLVSFKRIHRLLRACNRAHDAGSEDENENREY